jgi:hypothetical protein
MVFHVERQLFVVIWNIEVVMGRMCRGKENIEETVEFASANVADVANFHGGTHPRIWVPKGMSIGRKFDCKVVAEDIIVGHRAQEPSAAIVDFESKVEALTPHPSHAALSESVNGMSGRLCYPTSRAPLLL